VLAGGKLWLVSGEGVLIGADARTGQIVSNLDLGEPVFISPVVAGGRMDIFADNATLIALNLGFVLLERDVFHCCHRWKAECRQVHLVQPACRQAARSGRRPTGVAPRPARSRSDSRLLRCDADRYSRTRAW